LEELRDRTKKLASEYIPKLYRVLMDDYHFSPQESRTKIERDCKDIWAADTIKKYLPSETKSLAKRKAGKISADIKRSKKKRAEPKLLVAIGSSQYSDVPNKGNDYCYNEDPVGINPTENIPPVTSTKKESRITQRTEDVWDEKSFHLSLLVDRHKDEILEEEENLQLAGGETASKGTLLLPSELAKQIYSYIKAAASKNIPDFKLEYNGTKIISISRLSNIES